MAVYTKITSKHISQINKKFNFGKIVSFSGIKKGVENTNYLLKTKTNKYILTLFEKRVEKKDIPFFMNLMKQLNKSEIKCPRPLNDNKGNYQFKIKKKTASIVSFLEGKDKRQLSYKNCFDIGKYIAQMHVVTKKLTLFRKNSLAINKLDNLFKNINFKEIKLIDNLENFLYFNLKEIKNKWPKKLPTGIIHGDLFMDNIFFKKNKISGIIDFYFSGNDFYVYELAICINALCFDKKNNKFKINNKKIKNLINGYECIKDLSNKEKNSINILCKGAAIRYLLTRVYDYCNTPKKALIKIKDPREYFQKLLIHNNLKTYRDYIN